VKKLVYQADSTSVKHDDYDSILGQAVNGFLTHAKEEEDMQHPKMLAHLSPEENDVSIPLCCLIVLVLASDTRARKWLANF
jgi:hypothetical protein